MSENGFHVNWTGGNFMNSRKLFGALTLVCLAAMTQLPAFAQGRGGGAPAGARIYIWSGLKTHGAGQHDYPQFLADWSKVLTDHGAVVDGGLHMPSVATL